MRAPPTSTLFPYTTLFRSYTVDQTTGLLTFISGQSFPVGTHAHNVVVSPNNQFVYVASEVSGDVHAFSRNTSDRKSTRLNSSHLVISYAVFCLKKKKAKAT